MYNDRHNEANGEKMLMVLHGISAIITVVRVPSRKRFIREIRKLKWKDAMLLLFLVTGSAYDYGR